MAPRHRSSPTSQVGLGGEVKFDEIFTGPERQRLREFATKALIAASSFGLVASLVGIYLIDRAGDEISSRAGEASKDLGVKIKTAEGAAAKVQEDIADAKSTFVDGACASIQELQRTQQTGDDLKALIEGFSATTTSSTSTPPPVIDSIGRYERFVAACQEGK